MRCASVGPRNAGIVVIGEFSGKEEESQGKPFVGNSGQLLTSLLNGVGLTRDQCFITNALKDRPQDNKISLWVNPKKTAREGEVKYRGKWVRPNVIQDIEELHADLRSINPRVIIPLGNTALWAVTPHSSVSKWRGSYLASDVGGVGGVVIPTYHPTAILRQAEWRVIAGRDLRRAAAAAKDGPPARPSYRFRTASTYSAMVDAIAEIRNEIVSSTGVRRLIADLEIKRREIVCIGLGWSKLDAACLAFYDDKGRTITAEETADIWEKLQDLFKLAQLANQNVAFDITFMFEKAGIWPRPSFDTMLAQALIAPGTPKRLDYLASLFCKYYVYWKDDGKFWDKPIIFPQLWEYNCLDCVYTYEVMEAQEEVIAKLGMQEQMEFMMRLLRNTLKFMYRGVLVDNARRASLLAEIEGLIGRRVKVGSKLVHDKYGRLENEVNFMAGVNVDAFSWKQLQDFFYKRMGHKPILKKTMVEGKPVFKPTTDNDALEQLGEKDLLLAPICERINMIRSYNTAASVCKAKTASDGRWHANFTVGGAENFRYTCDENPFGEATNLQNLTTGKDIKG